MNRAVAAIALATLLVTSGCLGSLAGDESLTFEADPVSVSEAAKTDTGYERINRGSNTVNQSFSGRNVTVTNRFTELGRSTDLPAFGDAQIGRFTVFASPEVQFAGQTFNPLDGLSNRDLVLRLQTEYESISNIRAEGNRSDTVLGQDTTVSKFRADAETAAGQEAEVFIHVTKVKHGDDFVVVVAVHPTKLDGEEERVNRLLEGIQHET